jgi:histidine triad (HIT) family protein
MSEMTAGCPFCARIAAGEYDYSDRYAVAFEPLNPVTEGHLLVVPRGHVPDAGCAPEIAGRTLEFAAMIAGPLEFADWPGYNLIISAGSAASQTVMHLHIHIVPRRPGDELKLPWTQEPKCGYCYCPLGTSPECASGCGHTDRSGFAGCGRAS